MNTQRTSLMTIAMSLTLAGGLATALTASAQGMQPTAAAPQLPAGFKIVLDNEHVRVFESTFAPGVVVPARFYPHRTGYVIKGPAQMTTQFADGRVETLTSATGSVDGGRRHADGQQCRQQRGCRSCRDRQA